MLAIALKTGVIFKENNEPYQVQKYAHSQVARGSATVKVQARSLKTRAMKSFSFQGNKEIEDADVLRKNAQYLYRENGYIFMDPQSYEQITIPAETIGESAKFLQEGETVQVMYFENTPVSIELPINMTFTISYTEPGFKGNTVTNAFKDATLNNGVTIKVPTFIKIGDKIKINTRTGEYVSKA